MTVEMRGSFSWDRRPDPPDDIFVLHPYSALVKGVIYRAHDIAERHGEHIVRVEHFVDALFAEPDARIRLRELGYADDEKELREQRYQLLSRRSFAASVVPTAARGLSDLVKLWLEAAKRAAQKREPELHTVTVDDFVTGLNEDQELESPDLSKLQTVWARYKLPAVVPIRPHIDARFDHVDGAIGRAHADLAGRIGVVDGKVGGIASQVAGVSAQVAEVKIDTSVIRADTALLRTVLPREMRLSAFLMLLVLLMATVCGACVGLVARGQFGAF